MQKRNPTVLHQSRTFLQDRCMLRQTAAPPRTVAPRSSARKSVRVCGVAVCVFRVLTPDQIGADGDVPHQVDVLGVRGPLKVRADVQVAHHEGRRVGLLVRRDRRRHLNGRDAV